MSFENENRRRKDAGRTPEGRRTDGERSQKLMVVIQVTQAKIKEKQQLGSDEIPEVGVTTPKYIYLYRRWVFFARKIQKLLIRRSY